MVDEYCAEICGKLRDSRFVIFDPKNRDYEYRFVRTADDSKAEVEIRLFQRQLVPMRPGLNPGNPGYNRIFETAPMIAAVRDLGLRELPKIYFLDALAYVGKVFERHCIKNMRELYKPANLAPFEQKLFNELEQFLLAEAEPVIDKFMA